MAIADDISVAVNGDIRYTGTTTNYTVIEMHRFLQDLADDAVASGDDLVDITSSNPSVRSTDNIITLINGYNIDDTLAQHLYDGTIIQDGGDTIYDGIVNFGNAGIHIEVIQNGALITPNFWTTGLNADSNAGISHRFMVKVRTGGSDIDGRRLLGTTREFGATYSEFPINGTSRGNNVLALSNSNDLNNETIIGTVAGWTNITNTEGYRAIDVNNDGADEFYYSEWNKDTQSINDLFERSKWITRRGSSETFYGLSGEVFRGITHEIAVDTPTGIFENVEAVSWTGGTGQMLAIDSVSAGTKMWIQLLTGIAPTDGQTITGGTSSATVDVNVTVTERTVVAPFIGASTGSALIGSYGLGVEATDLTASDTLFDLSNTARNPPNYVTFTVNGLVSGEDRIEVASWDGSTVDANGDPVEEVDQLSASGTYTGGETTFTVVETIPSDTPSSGTIRVFDGTSYQIVSYTAYSGSDFTGCSGVPAVANLANVYVSYIDKVAGASSETVTVVYNADRLLVIKVRDGGVTPIKPFITTGTIGSGGGSTTAIRTADA